MRISLIIRLALLIALAIIITPSQSSPWGSVVVRAAPAIKQVFHRYSSRKAAKEAAQRASKGHNPVSHGAHKPGYSPHYHQTGPNGKPTDFSLKRPAGSDQTYRVHEHFQFPRKQG